MSLPTVAAAWADRIARSERIEARCTLAACIVLGMAWLAFSTAVAWSILATFTDLI